MVDPVTVNRSLAQPTRGSDSGTWDVPVNGNMGLLDTITGGITSITAVSGGSTILNAAQLACGTISISGAISTNATIDFPAIQGWWSIENLTTGSSLVIARAGSFTQAIGIPPGEITDIQVNGNIVKYRNLGRVGSYIDMVSSAVPTWISASNVPPYLICDGSTFSAGTYPYLNAILGGTTLPDLRGRARFYLNGGTNRITSAGSGIDGNTILSAGGAQNIAISTPNLPPYTPAGTPACTGILLNTGGGGQTTVNVATQNPAAGFAPGSGPIPGAQLINLSATLGTFSFAGSAQGGTNTPLNEMPPATISGITLIRAG